MKRVVFILSLFILSVAGVSIVNCNGTRVRTDDLGVSSSQVQSNLTSLSSLSTLSTGTSFATMYQSFMNIQNDPNGSTLYYAQAPSDMGASPYSIADFGGESWTSLNPAPPAPLTLVWIFFVVNSDASQAGLIIAAAGNSGVAASPTPIPVASPSSSPSATTVTVTPTYAYIAINDGQTALPNGGSPMAGNFSDTDYQIEMNANGIDDVTLQSFDVNDGDLTDTIQVNMVETQSQNYMGKFNVTIPE